MVCPGLGTFVNWGGQAWESQTDTDHELKPEEKERPQTQS